LQPIPRPRWPPQRSRKPQRQPQLSRRRFKLGLQFQACPRSKRSRSSPNSLAELTLDKTCSRRGRKQPNFRAELERLKIRQEAPPAGKFHKASLEPRR
jgi:hypothetical protein